MKRARLGASVISLLVTGLLGFSLAGSAGASPARPAERDAAGPVSVRTVVLDCPGLPGLASATGTLVKNTCTPSCVAGHFRSYRVLVVFWGKATVKNQPGQRCYTRMTLIYPGTRPNGVGQTQTVSLPTSLPA